MKQSFIAGKMTEQQQLWDDVDRYVESQLIPHDDVLASIAEHNRQAELPPIEVTDLQGQFLQLLVRMSGSQRILELGTLGGYSTIWMARALPEGGKIVTLELDEYYARTAAANFAYAGVSEQIDLRVGAALEQLQQLEQEGAEPFDFIFIDADKPNNPNYLQWALRLSHPGTIIVGDNVIRQGEVIDRHSSDPRVQGIRSFYELIRDEIRITATALQTVGEKGYDGFLIGIVN
ncbi:O-methyltransferase [Paenibacillus sp. WLX1005]|uniref:O-methyltransferase n=1 Tax=Paenibacillus sp. WLX1005 TaxID=3243766 RepID=UPI003984402B